VIHIDGAAEKQISLLGRVLFKLQSGTSHKVRMDTDIVGYLGKFLYRQTGGVIHSLLPLQFCRAPEYGADVSLRVQALSGHSSVLVMSNNQ
jgi:hypothetical protein